MRLDQYLVENNLVDSRNKAQQLIKDSKVSVNKKVITKASFKVSDECIELDDEYVYVSRAAYKLKNFLPLLPFDVKGMDALDIGSSTGGFTEVLLLNEVNCVTSVDVGSSQLHEKLLKDKRVRSLENQDIRSFKNDTPFELITCDVSFISLHHILETINILSSGYMILLFKPQFEVGRDVKRDKHGVVSDTKAISAAMLKFEDTCSLLGWTKILMQASSITGKEGNIEYCYCYKKD
ncbi:TlyA family RNA methyltransferase [Sulfurimonas sp. MAG313]|nr:TlyA family RNA methyltransferase [Sulfurimonas sp. MAG313]MDF1879779.1 TlyA family RNA methyltransferase [Sulfurimonas sp. MAG313]